MSDIASLLLKMSRSFVISPAGSGKTQAIADFVKLGTQGKQLVLTHTHAGVQSLKRRLRSLQVASSQYQLDTIAGWALKLSASYPQVSNFLKAYPQTNEDYKLVYSGAAAILRLPFMEWVIQASYGGVIVDEYQDCLVEQHELIIALANLIPCRILGDPLQGIYGFGRNETLVDWARDIQDNFQEILHTPELYRWKDNNSKLGDWISRARNRLETGNPITLDFQDPPRWESYSPQNAMSVCKRMFHAKGTVVVIHPENGTGQPCHELAKRLSGMYQSIEEMEGKYILEYAKKIELSLGNPNKLALILLDFVFACMTKARSELGTIYTKLKEEKLDFSRVKKYRQLAESLLEVCERDHFGDFAKWLRFAVQEIPDAKPYRKELWLGLLYTLEGYDPEKHTSLYDTAWQLRQRQKHVGRMEFPRIVSRTLLVKGLEYDHAILLDADRFNRNNLYVAMTRGSRTLTILSSSRTLNPRL